MTVLTKAQVRTMVQNAMDDRSATFWVANDLDTLISITADDLWTDIIDASPYFLSQLDTPTMTAPGYIDLSATSKRFHRIQQIVRNNRTYIRRSPRDTLIKSNAVLVGPDFFYTLYGNQAWLFPLSTVADVEFRYSYKPDAFTSLTDNTAVTWPEGHESALIYSAASRGMTRGDREENARIQAIADMAVARMLAVIGRRSTGPVQPYDTDSPVEFASVY